MTPRTRSREVCRSRRGFSNGADNVESYGNIMRRVMYPLQVNLGIADKEGEPEYGIQALRHAASRAVARST